MRIPEILRRHFVPDRPLQLSPEELEEARVLREVLKESGATDLLLAEKERKWGRAEIRAEALIKKANDDQQDTYTLETGVAIPSIKKPIYEVAVGAFRDGPSFGIFVRLGQETIFDGKSKDEGLRHKLSIAFGQVTLKMSRPRKT